MYVGCNLIALVSAKIAYVFPSSVGISSTTTILAGIANFSGLNAPASTCTSKIGLKPFLINKYNPSAAPIVAPFNAFPSEMNSPSSTFFLTLSTNASPVCVSTGFASVSTKLYTMIFPAATFAAHVLATASALTPICYFSCSC